MVPQLGLETFFHSEDAGTGDGVHYGIFPDQGLSEAVKLVDCGKHTPCSLLWRIGVAECGRAVRTA